jgi:apolipoprotein N-acyltransferase
LLRERASSADIFLWSEVDYPGRIKLADRPRPDDSGGISVRETVDAESGSLQLQQLARLAGAQVVMGCDRVAEDGTRFNCAAVFDPADGYLGCYDKVCLVPFSEFWPRRLPAIGPERSTTYAHGIRYPVFRADVRNGGRSFHFAATVCYDICFPEVYRRFALGRRWRARPGLLRCPVLRESHDKRMRLQRLLLDLARFRAIESHRAVVRNVAGGYAGVIDGNGILLDPQADVDFQEAINVGPMPIDGRFAPYTVLGDWPLIAGWATMLVVAARPWRSKRALGFLA